MKTPGTQLVFSSSLAVAGREALGRQILALDSLSKLTKQFSERPDFEHLVEILLMTLCGQFSTSDSFALLNKPGAQNLNQLFFATGRFKNDVLLTSLQVGTDDLSLFSAAGGVHRVADMAAGNEHTELVAALEDRGVEILCPLVQGDALLGVVGMGARVTERPYGDEDVDLLSTIMNTITPLMANSYLFWEITNLNAWYLDILNSVRQGVFVFDKNRRLKKVNSTGAEILRNLGLHEMSSGTPINALIRNVFPQTVFGDLALRIAAALAGGRAVAPTSIVARSNDEERIYNVGMTDTVESAEIGTALVVTLEDITLQKGTEERLFDLQKLADKGLMASAIAHELNNFVGLILGGVELMGMAVAKGDYGKLGDTLDKVRTGVTKLERFTAGLTDYSRLASSKSWSNLNRIIRDLLMFVSVQKRFKRIQVTSDLDASIPDFQMDPDQIAQLLINLLNNAADAIKQSRRHDGEIVTQTSLEGDIAVLVVSDNGAGMPDEVRKQLFASNFTTKHHGHGYGLETCAKIVESHGGSIEIRSTPGEGSTFTIRLPARF
jgi:signal transduction histidine kinase